MVEQVFLAVNIRPLDFHGSCGTFGVVGQVDDDVVQPMVVTGAFFVGAKRTRRIRTWSFSNSSV